MAITYHDMTATTTVGGGYGQFYSTLTPTANTDKRDVSEVLDLWAHRETPFLNKLSWGPDSGANSIEWVSEHLGWGYVETSTAIASAGTAAVFYDPARAATVTPDVFGLGEGALLYGYSSTDGEHGLLLIDSIDAAGTATFEYITTTFAASLAASSKLYIIGNFANEGSVPRPDASRTRSLLSNNFTILRKDINMTGSQQATDMWAVPDELRHQTTLRLLEMQREREMTVLYSAQYEARSTTKAALFNGVLGYLLSQSGTHIDTTTTALTETALNNVVAECWENGGTPNIFVGAPTILRKFTDWEKGRIRTSQDERIGGSYITSYLTDIGIEIQLVPMRKVPRNLAFVLDTTAMKLRAKTGRKLLVEKLGKNGDFDRWQMISEFSLEFRGYDKAKQGLFTRLAS